MRHRRTRTHTHPAVPRRSEARRYISAVASSDGRGVAPGWYQRPNAVPSSTCGAGVARKEPQSGPGALLRHVARRTELTTTL